MVDRPTSPRIAPLAPEEYDEQARALLGVASAGTAVNIFATLVRHPGLFRKWLPFGGKMLAGRLPGRERELVILRAAWRCASEYEWGQHVVLARQVGLTDIDTARVREGPDAPGWTEHESALLRAVDELHDDACITDTTWATLAQVFDERQLIELPMLVGQYHLVAFALNSLGVQREPGVIGFDG